MAIPLEALMDQPEKEENPARDQKKRPQNQAQEQNEKLQNQPVEPLEQENQEPGGKNKQEYKPVFCANFFDTENPARSIRFREETLDFQAGDKKFTGNIRHRDTHVEVVMTADDCTGLQKYIGKGKDAEISSTTFKNGCATYLTCKVQFHLTADSPTCSYVQVPTSMESEACMIKFKALRKVEGGDKDKDARVAMEESVVCEIREIQTVAPGSTGKGNVGLSSQAFSTTITTNKGLAEAFGLPRERLYQFNVQAPAGWRCAEPVFYRYVCCDTSVEIKCTFESCDCKPTRTLVFVEKGCQGVRWAPSADGTGVSLGGTPLKIEKGLANVSSDIRGGALTLTYAGKAFEPPFVDLTGDGPAVTTITVSDQPAIKAARIVQGQLVAEDGKTPFARRKIHCKLPNQHEIQLITDEQGCFSCEEGSVVHAEEDEYGLEIAPVLLREIE